MPRIDDIIGNKDQYPDDTQITLPDGTPITLGEVRAGYMKDADYRRKTSELAQSRRELEQLAALRAQELQAAEQRLVELAAQVVTGQAQRQQANAAMPSEGEDEEETDPRIKRLRDELATIRQTIDPLAQAVLGMDQRMRQSALAYLAQQHQQVLQRLKQEDPELNEQELIAFARQRMIPRLDDAYRLYRFDKLVEKRAAEAKESGLKEGYQKAKAESPLLPLRRGVFQPAEKPKSLEDAFQQALKDPEVIGPLVGMPTKP